MNKERRDAISKLVLQLGEIQSAVEEIRDEEQEAHDALPESVQSGDQGERMQAAVDSLDSAADALSNVVNDLETASE